VLLGLEIKRGESIFWIISSTAISMEKSCRELWVDILINWDIFKNNQIKLFLMLHSKLKNWEYLKQGSVFTVALR